jgi:hypothetical protein
MRRGNCSGATNGRFAEFTGKADMAFEKEKVLFLKPFRIPIASEFGRFTASYIFIPLPQHVIIFKALYDGGMNVDRSYCEGSGIHDRIFSACRTNP